MTAAPSETDEVFTTAFPPTKSNVIGIGHDDGKTRWTKIRTFGNLINYFLRGSSIEVIHNDVCTSRCKKERVPIQTQNIKIKQLWS